MNFREVGFLTKFCETSCIRLIIKINIKTEMGYKQKKDTPPMERELNYLLADLCVKWGFCIPPDDWKIISKAEAYTKEQFAEDVVSAEGMNPEHDARWVKKIAERFRERFGQDNIDASSFVDRVRGQREDWS
jgi:hypothetical protein